MLFLSEVITGRFSWMNVLSVAIVLRFMLYIGSDT